MKNGHNRSCFILLKNQLFRVYEPIPSLKLHSLEYKEGKWVYCYAIETPVLLKDTKRRSPLYLSGFLSNMKLVDKINKNLINTEIYCKQDIYNLLDEQREADKLFRKKFLEAHPDFDPECEELTFTLENRSQRAVGRMIARLKEDNGELSTFVGRA